MLGHYFSVRDSILRTSNKIGQPSFLVAGCPISTLPTSNKIGQPYFLVAGCPIFWPPASLSPKDRVEGL